jgi:subtilisin family serine protease
MAKELDSNSILSKFQGKEEQRMIRLGLLAFMLILMASCITQPSSKCFSPLFVEPRIANPGDTITIRGLDSSCQPTVFIGSEQAKITSREATQLTVSMPNLEPGEYQVRVEFPGSSGAVGSAIGTSSISVLWKESAFLGDARDPQPVVEPKQVMISIPADVTRDKLTSLLDARAPQLNIKRFRSPLVSDSRGPCGKTMAVLEGTANMTTAEVINLFQQAFSGEQFSDWQGDPHSHNVGSQASSQDDPAPEDPIRGWSWKMAHVPSGTKLQELASKLSTIRVAVIDTGISSRNTASEFERAGSPSTLEIFNGADVTDDSSQRTPEEDYILSNIDSVYGGHGTGIAAIIGARNYNATGGSKPEDMIGVAPEVRILGVKICSRRNEQFGEDGKPTSPPECLGFNTLVGICYSIHQNAKIINLSLGGLQPSKIIYEALKEAAIEHKIVLVAAAGNQNKDNRHYPAAYSESSVGSYDAIPGLISVGAVDNTGNRAEYSNYGTWVNIMAPGGGINPESAGIWTAEAIDHGFFHGTSFATPFVSGTAALILASNPNLTPAQVKARIVLSGLSPVGNCPPKACGAGLLDVTRSINVP